MVLVQSSGDPMEIGSGIQTDTRRGSVINSSINIRTAKKVYKSMADMEHRMTDLDRARTVTHEGFFRAEDLLWARDTVQGSEPFCEAGVCSAGLLL